MTTKAGLSLLIALLLPIAGYFIVKHYSEGAVHMPRRYFFDSVAVSDRGGKTVNDTIWHKVNSPVFINQLGEEVTFNDARGKILVVNFFFTRCPVVCPGLTRNMKKLQQSFEKNPDIVQFVSITVDPEYDSVHKLRAFADKYRVNHDTWWLVTGGKQEIYDFAFKEMKANIADPKIDTAFIHTEDFFLLDTNRVVRGWYSGFDSLALAKLARDIPTLMLEKDKSRPSILRRFIPFLPVIFIGIGVVIVVVTIMGRRRKLTNNY